MASSKHRKVIRKLLSPNVTTSGFCFNADSASTISTTNHTACSVQKDSAKRKEALSEKTQAAGHNKKAAPKFMQVEYLDYTNDVLGIKIKNAKLAFKSSMVINQESAAELELVTTKLNMAVTKLKSRHLSLGATLAT